MAWVYAVEWILIWIPCSGVDFGMGSMPWHGFWYEFYAMVWILAWHGVDFGIAWHGMNFSGKAWRGFFTHGMA